MMLFPCFAETKQGPVLFLADPWNSCSKVSCQMRPRKLMITAEAMLDYEKPKPNPRHDDKGKSGGG